ncbi:MAG: cyanophycinase [Bacteroidales bacterium]|nr:cyanophycinase [Bacteroidales bacterium]MCF8333732.1 cyanophycinase [Bacteroidales bacterium]
MKNPKGMLIVIGGEVALPSNANANSDSKTRDMNGEKPETGAEILNKFCELLPSAEARIEVISTASSIPKKSFQHYRGAFKKLGFENVENLDVRTREEASNPDTVERIKKADGFLFTGGDQLRLTTILGGTEFLKVLIERYEQRHVVIAGTSAGAMAMSDTMIYEGSSHEAMRKGEIKFSSGFGLLDNVIIDTHFVKRGRFGRLFQAVTSNPSALGIGLGEDTSLFIKNGDIQEVIGSGLIIIIDGSTIRHTNMAAISEGEMISVENISLHVMVPGDKLRLSDRKYIPFEEQNLSRAKT